MRATVFKDEGLAGQAGRFVWLDIDTEKARNAAFVAQFPLPAYPTYFVIDPRDEHLILKWVGGATLPQLNGMLDDARASFDTPPGTEPTTPQQLLAEADRLYGAGRTDEATAYCERAINAAPKEWPSRARAVEALLVTWSLADACDKALPLAQRVLPDFRGTTSIAVVGGVGLDCAAALPADDPRRAEVLPVFEEAVREAVADLSLGIAPDDRSGLYISLLSAREAEGDSAGIRTVAADWSAFLDGAAAAATTAEERTVYDSHRLSAYMELGQAERAIPMLEQSAQDFPDDYNPPARLAAAYKALGRWDEALAAADRAVALGYGPRLLGILRTRADILMGKGDTAGARATLEDALRRAGELPEAQQPKRTMEALRKKLDELPAATG